MLREFFEKSVFRIFNWKVRSQVHFIKFNFYFFKNKVYTSIKLFLKKKFLYKNSKLKNDLKFIFRIFDYDANLVCFEFKKFWDSMKINIFIFSKKYKKIYKNNAKFKFQSKLITKRKVFFKFFFIIFNIYFVFYKFLWFFMIKLSFHIF